MSSNTISVYRGSNPEYLVCRDNGQTVQLDEYREKVLPILRKAFPRIDYQPSGQELDELDAHEWRVIGRNLQDAGYRSIPIPKTLYDLFYLLFHFQAISKRAEEVEGDQDQKKEYIQALYISRGGVGDFFDGGPYQAPNYVDCVLEEQSDSLEKLRRQNFSVCMLQLKPKIHEVVERFKANEEHNYYTATQCLLNNCIIKYLKDANLDFATASWEQVQQVIANIFKTMRGYSKAGAGGSPSIFWYFNNADIPRAQELVSAAIKHEFQQDPAYYTIYRATKSPSTPSIFSNKKPESLSFGASVLAGFQFDQSSGCSFVLGVNGRAVYAVDLLKREHRSPATQTAHLLSIPPARGMNRISGAGEFYHPRTKVYFENSDMTEKVEGIDFYNGSTPTAEIAVSHLRADPDEYQTRQDFTDQVNRFLASCSTLIMDKKVQS